MEWAAVWIGCWEALHGMAYLSGGGWSPWKMEVEPEAGALCPLLCNSELVLSDGEEKSELWRLAVFTSSRSSAVMPGDFRLREADFVCAFPNTPSRRALSLLEEKGPGQKPGCEHSWEAWVWVYKEKGKEGDLGPHYPPSPFLYGHSSHAPSLALWLFSPAVLWEERDGEKSKHGEKHDVIMLGREGLSLLYWHWDFFPSESKIPRLDISPPPNQ